MQLPLRNESLQFETEMVLIVPLALVKLLGTDIEKTMKTLTPRNASALSVMQDMDNSAAIDLALIVRSDMENRFNALSSPISWEKTKFVPVERIRILGWLICKCNAIVQRSQTHL